MTIGGTDERISRLVFWNRVWLTILILLLFGWAAFAYFRSIISQAVGVKTFWSGETLIISTLAGHTLVTHLVGASPRGTPVGARLPNPFFILDSESPKITKSEYDKLEWRNEGGMIDEPPPVGSTVRALFVQLDASHWSEPMKGC